MEDFVDESAEALACAFNTTISEPMLYSTSKNDEERIRCALKWMKKHAYMLDIIKIFKKSNTEAEKHIDNGNNWFRLSQFNNAHTLYSRAVFTAEINSSVLARAYANRSAVLYEKHCCTEALLDIDRALTIGYPDQLKIKLYLRRIKCLLALDQRSSPEMSAAVTETCQWIEKTDEKNQSAFKTTLKDLLDSPNPPTFSRAIMDHKLSAPDLPENNQILQASNAIELKYSAKKYGRYFEAARDIDCGEALLVEKAWATVPARSLPLESIPTIFITYHCSHCYKHIAAGIPCTHCICSTYCSEKCRYDDWNDCHSIECPVISALLGIYLFEPVFLSLKMTIKAVRQAETIQALRKQLKLIDTETDPVAKFFKKGVFDSSKYTSVYPLLRESPKNPVPWVLAVQAARALVFLARHSKILGKNMQNIAEILSDKSAIFVGALILKNLKISLHYMQPHEFFSEYTLAPKARSYSIMPLMSLFNHSCDANTCVYSYNNTKTIFALEKIRKGEQIFVSYKNIHFEHQSKDERVKILHGLYNFECSCRACSNNWTAANLPSFENLPLEQTVKDDVSKLMVDVEKYIQEFNLINAKSNEAACLAIKSFVQLMYRLNVHLKSPCREIVFVKQLLTRVYRNLSF